MEFKYIMLKTQPDSMAHAGMSLYIPIVFPAMLVHKQVADYMVNLLCFKHDMPATVDSAGFLNLGTGACFGDSETLKLKANPERDSRIIQTMSFTHGILEED